MVRPNMQPTDSSDKKSQQPAFMSGASPEFALPDFSDVTGKDSDDDNPPEPDPEPSDQDDDYGDDDEFYSFDSPGRRPENAAAEALRRSRQTQADIATMAEKLDNLAAMIQTAGAGAAPRTNGPAPIKFSDEDRAAINEAMKQDPAGTMEILQAQLMANAAQYADQTIQSRMAADAAKRDAEMEAVRMYPQMRNHTHPFRRAVTQRVRELRQAYTQRGMNPDHMPELMKFAAMEVAATNPELVGSGKDRGLDRESSRRRQADRATQHSQNRGGHAQNDNLPELSAADIQRGRRMGLNMDDPSVRKSLVMRRKYYEGRRR